MASELIEIESGLETGLQRKPDKFSFIEILCVCVCVYVIMIIT